MNGSAQDPVAIYYSRDVGYAAHLSAEICAGPETSGAVVTLNYDGGAEIGTYLTTLGDDDFRRALALLRGSRYERMPTPPPVLPETPFVVLGERRAGEEAALRYFPAPHMPAEVSEAARELEQTLVADIRQHRRRVVGAAAAWHKQVFDPREPLALRVTLDNRGPLPIVIGNPLDPALEWTGLNLAVRRAGDAGGEDMVRLDPQHLRLPPGAPVSGEVTLAPGDALSFGVEKKVYLPPGNYLGRLVYMNVIDRPGDPQFVQGQLSVDLGAVAIEAPPPW